MRLVVKRALDGMNYAKLVERHIALDADLTVGTLPVGVQAAAGQFGVVEVDGDDRVVGFEEKPPHPKSIPGDPHHAYLRRASELRSDLGSAQ